MTEDTDFKSSMTGWGFLATVAEAWPLLLAGPLALGVLAFFVVNAPVQVTSTASLPIPYAELAKVSLPGAVDAALLEPGFEMDRSQVLRMLFTAPEAGNIERSTLWLRYAEPLDGGQRLDGGELLERITSEVMDRASLTYAKSAKELMAEDIANIHAKISTLEQASASIKSALSAIDVAAEDIGGLAEAALALVQIGEDLHAQRMVERSLRQELAKFEEEFARPVIAKTEQMPTSSPMRTALLVAVGAEVLLLVAVIIWNKLRRLRPSAANAPELARIRRAFGLARRSG